MVKIWSIQPIKVKILDGDGYVIAGYHTYDTWEPGMIHAITIPDKPNYIQRLAIKILNELYWNNK